MRMGYMFMDSSYILVLIGAALCLITSGIVKSTFNKYSKVAASSGMTGRMVAEAIIHREGLYDVRVERVAGSLTDNFNPATKVVNLSESVYDVPSVAAISVAAHECGHAIQHRDGYFPLKLRSLSVPVANFGSWLSWPVIILGIALDWLGLAQVGIFLFAFVVQALEVLQARVDLLFGIVAHAAGVDEDGIGLFQFFARFVAGHLHDAGYHLTVGYVHLAAVCFNK